MFTERELDEIQDQIKQRAVARAEREEARVLTGAKVLLMRCTMCTHLARRIILPGEPEHDLPTEELFQKYWREPSLHECSDRFGQHHRKYGCLIPIGVLSPW